MKPNEIEMPKEKFNFAKMDGKLHDKELQTKPIGYFRDAFNRFKKNQASIIATVIIILLLLFAIVGPIFSPYKVSYKDTYYHFTLPKNNLFFNTSFWDGCAQKDLNETSFLYYYSMGVETGHNAIKNQKYKMIQNKETGELNIYRVRLDSYQSKGVVFMDLLPEEYQSIQQYQNETGIQVIYPITNKNDRPEATQDTQDANFWFKTKKSKGKTEIVLDENGDYIPIYRNYSSGFDDYSSIRIEGETPLYDYAIKNQTGYQCRINYYEYYIYYHSYVMKDGITSPQFLFGSTSSGQDLFTCLSSGARFSFILAIVIASVNLFVGAIYGAIEGYYGGKIDLAMERFVDILGSIPFMVVITLLKYHMEGNNQVLILFIAFFLTGWISMAGRTRMQFYRFKNQEYVLAARTLGASDKRIMFKHIFPNSLGTLITSCVLVIPSVIFSETSLSYLGIINLNSGNRTSVGTLLANGQQYLVTYPHLILFPSIFISLLMLSFNLFGNGLRDAFNPSLRGTED